MKIAYLGPEGSYSHLAAEKFLQEEKLSELPFERNECVPFRNFSEALGAVETGRVQAAAVPIANSLQGGVLQVLDLLQASDCLYAVKELTLKVDHRLVYREGTPYSRIGRVYSHRQALDQCSEFLKREMPFASLRETESTGFGVGKASEDGSGTSAAIAGSHLKRLPKGFVMSEECISDERRNHTQFLLIKRGREALNKNSGKVFFVASCPHRPGSLLGLLEIIARFGINMTRIESRPVKSSPGHYRFFIEAEADVGGEAFSEAFSEMREKTSECKLLGVY